MSENPVFYDATGRRRRRFLVAAVAFALLLVLAVAAFAATVLDVVPQSALPFHAERAQLRKPTGAERLVAQGRQTLRHTVHAGKRLFRTGPAVSPPLAVAFHAPWDDASAASLQRNISQLDWLVPGWLSITGPQHQVTLFPDARGRAIIAGAARRPKVLPMVQNALNGEWDGAGAAALMRDPTARKTALDRIEALLVQTHADGVFFDFESLPDTVHPYYRRFLTEARARFAPRNWVVSIAVPAADPAWDLAAYAKVADKLFLMAYDEHYAGGTPGPIASQEWFENVVARAARDVPVGHLVVAVASYAYDWHKGGTDALAVDEAWLAAKESDVVPRYDKASGNSAFAYDEDGERHEVWLADAASAYHQIDWLRKAGIQSLALWRLGSEDPSLWRFFGRNHRKLPPANVIDEIPAGTDVDIEGTGEVLRIGDPPVAGHRKVTVDAKGELSDVVFSQLPSPWTVQRTGYRPGLVALTFDDGPDPKWTPQILDVLKAKHVPATFFIIGDNGLTQRGLLQRLIAEGHEVGNHTYTHPNLATTSDDTTMLELNATQRLFQAFTGRSLRLFRAPYFGDAEPSTADEIGPAYAAQQRGYLSVGLHVDPDDWMRPGAQAIVDRTVAGVEAGDAERSGNIVLLHDAGGDRAQTVAALPVLIDRLRAKGYRFVPVSELAGLPRDMVNPPISSGDRWAARADLGLFLTLGGLTVAIKWLFAVAITLGILRALALSLLALIQARREAQTVFPAIDPTTEVTVLIPAFNEERVIERAVRRVLDSRDVAVKIVVIDDGSSDRTSAVVAEAFADEPRVRLMTLANGGKARALNTALLEVTSDIVIALDADTQFEETTIARLARWFVDPKLGAVAGNAKVGNRVNLITRWQALEYITAQNLERRALARLDAMTVVPGAVGAWRVATLRQVGGYPTDTLAEDQDLTIAIQRAGWRVHYDQYAVAWTEAPENIRGLAKQRFRWAFGTLQCLWKHGRVIREGHPKGLARVGLPQAILFQVVLAAISPIIDLALILSVIGTWTRVAAHGWAQTQTDVFTMLTYWLIFTAIDLLAAFIAFALERREKWRLLWLLIPQRIGYRQIMYYVVCKAIVQAMRGPSVGWGKLDRSGRVTAA
ncbi:glycosyltransferase [Microvirga sp. SRT01]|uniref:Chitooligosaccharide deacetylase n=1 Tax=Sphingomonas longa TaxID=2778730 RepID=A0ABS2DCX9_9SPHN|nr:MULTISPECIES: glycosyltransferase [Alphaproteobacteria]MBM6577919.1 glycosyltransferase [Sphingomonas sp. BT552]MBR7710960.1 glycosyltransferase [Microvirga sp. SRT01]